MVQLRTQRTALLLFSLLLILPTVVLGGLQWRVVTKEHEAELALLPDQALGLARRMRNVIADRLESLVEGEDKRPFDQYARYCAIREAGQHTGTLVQTPLETDSAPEGILAWFAFERLPGAAPTLFWSEFVPPKKRDALEWDLSLAAREIVASEAERPFEQTWEEISEALDVRTTAAQVVALRCTPEEIDCIRALLPELHAVGMDVQVSALRLYCLRQGTGPPHLFATRLVQVDSFPTNAACLERLHWGQILVQGFFLDPDWYFRELPAALAADLLDPTQRFVPIDAGACCDPPFDNYATLNLLGDLPIEVLEPALDPDFGAVRLAVDSTPADERFASQRLRFLLLAGMLALSLALGLALLLRSVAQDLERARRTENFVAAVTHELRTPLSGIRLHAEMLQDGWASEPEQQAEYHRRIVRETDRLETLVERVLEKSRLTSTSPQPAPGDLNAAVREVAAALLDDPKTGGRDLALELAPDLAPVLMTSEAIRSILVNLVENARKYAPPNGDAPEPILIRTLATPAGVALQVLDRGPGIAPKEARNVFQAFYRVGNEATRTSRGTGLGLHLVALQAAAIGGSASVRARPGGGALFEVLFARAA